MAKAVSSTIQLFNSVSSNCVNSLYVAVWAFASMCFPIALVPCSGGCQRTWWHTIHLIPGLLVSSISQCKYIRHEDTGLELFQAIRCFKPTCIEAHQTLKMICKLRLLKSQIKTRWCLEEMITSSNEESNDFEPDMALELRNQEYPTLETAERYIIVKQNVGSWILTLELHTKKIRSVRHWMYICKVVYKDIVQEWPRTTQFRNNGMQFIAVQCTEPVYMLLTLCGGSIVRGRQDIVTSIYANIGCR